MRWFFLEFTPAHPYWASLIKFLVLGTAGEWLGGVIRTRSPRPFPPTQLLAKLVIWGALGVVIRFVFASFALLVPAQAAAGLLPALAGQPGSLAFALAVSAQMNILFSPVLMVLHRAMDNLAAWRSNWGGLGTAMRSIVWFWLPAHTVTFLLPESFRVLFAALLSVALGLILGFANRERPAADALRRAA